MVTCEMSGVGAGEEVVILSGPTAGGTNSPESWLMVMVGCSSIACWEVEMTTRGSSLNDRPRASPPLYHILGRACATLAHNTPLPYRAYKP
jgi:hypothetical protein